MCDCKCIMPDCFLYVNKNNKLYIVGPCEVRKNQSRQRDGRLNQYTPRAGWNCENSCSLRGLGIGVRRALLYPSTDNIPSSPCSRSLPCSYREKQAQLLSHLTVPNICPALPAPTNNTDYAPLVNQKLKWFPGTRIQVIYMSGHGLAVLCLRCPPPPPQKKTLCQGLRMVHSPK